MLKGQIIWPLLDKVMIGRCQQGDWSILFGSQIIHEKEIKFIYILQKLLTISRLQINYSFSVEFRKKQTLGNISYIVLVLRSYFLVKVVNKQVILLLFSLIFHSLTKIYLQHFHHSNTILMHKTNIFIIQLLYKSSVQLLKFNFCVVFQLHNYIL